VVTTVGVALAGVLLAARAKMAKAAVARGF